MHKICLYTVLFLSTISCDPFYSYMHLECENKSGECPAYPNYMIKPLSFKVGDSIRFKNDFGFEIGFRVEVYNLSDPRELSCSIHGSDYCVCGPCQPFQSFEAITEDVPQYSSMGLNKIALRNSSSFEDYAGREYVYNNLIIQVFDAQIGSQNSSRNFPISDNFHESFELGGINYNDVSIYNDTSAIISKVYISMAQGIIGFDETETPSTFYLTE